MSYKSLKDVYVEQCLGVRSPELPHQSINGVTFLTLVEEGGAAGHMDHPFDLPQVKTGKDLINVFNKAAKSIETTPPAVKIDGVNASIKLVTNADGSMEFGLDRGSNKPLDVKGVTVSDLSSRFSEGHGMIAIGKEVLDIFNKALPVIKDDLQKLGFFKKPLIFNMEYVKGGTNVIGYASNFLAIHGINEIYEVKSPVKGSVSRATKEISYNKDAMQSLINTVNKIAKNYGFQIYGSVPAEMKSQPNIAGALSTELTVKYTPEHAETKTIGNWLQQCKNPRGVKITLSDGKKVDALSKFVYSEIHRGVAVNEFVKDANKNDVTAAVAGAVFYEAVRVIGQAILDAMTSPIGDISEQEGVVIRDPSISPRPFKLTGNFITRGLESKFAKSQDNQEIASPGVLTKHYLNNFYSTRYAVEGGANRVGEGGATNIQQ